MTFISLERGVPAPELLPVEELANCARAALERDGATVLNYGPVGGYAPLREWIAERHGVAAGRVLVTNGSLEGLNLVLAHFAARGRLLVEAPTYDRILAIARRLEAPVVGVPQDEGGLDVEALEADLNRDPSPALLYVLPTFQNPTGRTLSLERRRRLLEIADRFPLTVLEDDPYGALRFEGEPLPKLHALDRARVVFSSSFSKIVAPGIRVGYFVLPEDLARELESIAVNVYLAPSFFSQATLYEFLRRGGLEPNVARVSGLLRERRDAMLAALEKRLPGAGWTRPEGGYFVWIELPGGVDACEAQAEADGVTFVGGSAFYPDAPDGGSSARLAFSFASPAEIEEGIGRLAEAIGRLSPAAVT